MQLVVSSEQNSKWMPFVQKQVKTQMYDLSFTGFRGFTLFVVKGPAKLMPVKKDDSDPLVAVPRAGRKYNSKLSNT